MSMQQLDIFDVFNDFDKESDIHEVLARSLITVDGKEIDRSLVVAVFVPDKKAIYAEPAISTLENGVYKYYRWIHGHLYDDSMPDSFNWSPGYYWTWL